jgi:Flp pilus assembly protein TadB
MTNPFTAHARRASHRAVAVFLMMLFGLTVVAPAGQAETPAKRAVVIAIDASGSMAGARMSDARAAAMSFVRALPTDVAVGVIAFADRVQTPVSPTMDRSAIEAAIGAIRAQGDTALIDAVDAALGFTPDRVVVLSDGKDTASTMSMSRLRAVSRASGIPIDVVALNPSAEQARVLRSLTADHNGTYVRAKNSASLAAAFLDLAEGVAAPVSPTVAASPTLAAPAAVPAPTVTAKPGAQAQVASFPILPLLFAIVAAAAVALLALGLAALLANARHRRAVEEALTAYTAPKGAIMSVSTASNAAALLHDRLRDTSWYARMSRRLDLAGIDMPPALWLVILLGSSLGAALLFGVLASSVLLGVIVGMLAYGGFAAVVSSRVSAALREFDDELPDFLLLVASGMRSGLSFTQAMDAGASEGTGQVSRQMTRVVAEARLGTPIEEALLQAAARMQSDDLRWTVTALAMQRQVGGNLSTILETAAAAVRGRAELRREVRTLSAEGRLSAYVLVGLPICVFLFMALTRREYVDFFWTERLGLVSLTALVAMVIAGALWIRSIIRIEV